MWKRQTLNPSPIQTSFLKLHYVKGSEKTKNGNTCSNMSQMVGWVCPNATVNICKSHFFPQTFEYNSMNSDGLSQQREKLCHHHLKLPHLEFCSTIRLVLFSSQKSKRLEERDSQVLTPKYNKTKIQELHSKKVVKTKC